MDDTVRQKEIGVLVVVALYTIAFFAIATTVIRGDVDLTGLIAWILGVGALIWAAMIASAYVFLRHVRKGRAIASGVCSVGVFVFGGMTGASLVSAGILLALLALTSFLIALDMERFVKVSPHIMLWRGAQMALLALFVALIAFSFPFMRGHIAEGNMAFSREQIANVLTFLPEWIARPLGEFEPNSTVNDVIENRHNANILPFNVHIAQEGGHEEMVQSIGHQLGVDVDGEDTLAHVTTNMVNKRIRTIGTQEGLVVTILVVVTALVTMKAIIPILVWPTLGLIALIFSLSRRFGLISIQKKEAVVERVRL